MGQPRGKQLHSSSGRTTKKREYNCTLRRAEQELAAVQQAYAEEHQQYLQTREKIMLLAELVDIQERCAAVYEKHQRWLAAGGPTEAWPEQETVGLQQLGADRPRWVMFLLETATWEQLQRALSLSCEDWMVYHQQYCADLRELIEIRNKCPDIQSLMLRSVTAAVQPPPASFPAAYASSSSSGCRATPSRSRGEWSQNIANHNMDGSGDRADAAATEEQLQADDVILHMLKTTGVLAYVALLHGCPAIFEAAALNNLTGEVHLPSPMHWVSVARRMKFSRQQKAHFRLALKNFARQAKAVAESGLNILQETPSYAFLLACETIAARQPSSKGSPGPPADVSQDMPAQHAAAAAAGGSQAATAVTASQGVPTASNNTPPPPQDAGQPETSARQQAVGPASATAAAAAVEMGAPVSGAGGSSMSTEGMQGSAAAPAAEPVPGPLQECMLVDSPAEDLQRQVKLYFRSVTNLNIFLADTLTLDQALLLNVASFPFWPMLSAVAEAAMQLPDASPEPEDSPHMQGVQLLMGQRRNFMEQLHSEWLGGIRDNVQQQRQPLPCDDSIQQDPQ